MDFEAFRTEEINRKQHVFVIKFVMQNFYMKDNVILPADECLLTFDKHYKGIPDMTNQKLMANIIYQYDALVFSIDRREELLSAFNKNEQVRPPSYKEIPSKRFDFIVSSNVNQYLKDEGFVDFGEGFHFIVTHESPLVYQSFLIFLINELQSLLFNKEYADFINEVYMTHYN